MGEACEKRSTPLSVPSRNFSKLSHFLLEAKFQPGANFIGFQSVLAINFQPSLSKKKSFHLGSKLMCDTNIFNIFFLEIENSIPGQNCMCEGVLSKEASFFPIMEAISTRFENRTCTM